MKSAAPLAALAACALLAGCAAAPPGTEGPPRATAEQTAALLDAAIAGEHRSEANRARDAWRHPKETLLFFGLRADMAVMEIWPGAGGWYMEILAPALRERGRYFAAQWDPASDSQFVQDALKAFRAKLASRPDLYDKVEVVALQHPGAMTPVPAGSLDMVLTFRNIHNWMPRDAAKPMFEAMYAALKPGGILGVVEHRAAADDAPQDPKARSGYVREDYAIELITSVGFELEGTSEINANPRDTKDYDQGVWTLPPTLRLGDRDREKYVAIGESDRFTLRFRKPAAAQ
ncbi:MAG: methyltransferase [Steroidobacteraceae bacterium]|jgi:predicted methyltransferase|nr:methyltransferase [Steroidobacteraceae bacterium]